jgi:hypothetical protein
MVTVRHIVEWEGERYTIEPLKSLSRVTVLSPTWAVFRRGEFIGTLPYRSDETPMEFESRCISWLRDLLRDFPHAVSTESEKVSAGNRD